MKLGGQKIRRHFFFYGRVQGVGFRFRAYMLAKELGVTGWVRNVDDFVEMEAQGWPEDIEMILKRLPEDSWIEIEQMESHEIPLKQEKEFQMTW